MRNIRRLVIPVGLVLGMMLLACAAGAATWDLSSDWSGSSNPNGVWSYGWRVTTVGGPITLYDSAGSYSWGTDPGNYGSISKNSGTGVVTLRNGPMTDTHEERQAVVRWTSPISGQVHVFGSFTYDATKIGKALINHNGTEIYSTVLVGRGFPLDWDFVLTVAAGDTIEFIATGDTALVHPGGNSPLVPYHLRYVNYVNTWATITTDPVGTITGTVVGDTSGGEPVPHAVVKSTDGRYATSTGTDGTYSMRVLPGTYSLIASSGHYASQQIDGIVASGGDTTDVDFLLGGASVSGTVTSGATGLPISGAIVKTMGEGTFLTTTDSAGRYTIKVQPGYYNLLVMSSGYVPMKRSIRAAVEASPAADFVLRTAGSGRKVSLPAPIDWGEPPSASAAPGDSFPVAFAETGSLPPVGAPAIAGWNETVKPDESFTLTGARFTTRTGDDAGTDTTVWVWARTSKTGGVLKQAKLWKVTGETILATMPDDIPYGAYLVWVENSEGMSAPVLINRVRATFVGPCGNITYPGATIRVVGKNISHNRGSSASDAYVYVQSTTGGAFQSCTVTRVDPYMVEFTLPVGLSHGNYNVFVHNGHGGSYGWSDPLEIVVQAQWVRGSTQINLTPGSSDDTANIQGAIDTLAGLPNGGTVNLSAGSFIVTGPISLKSNVELKGAGPDATFITLQLSQSDRPLRLMGNRIALTDLTVQEASGSAPIGYTGIITTAYMPDSSYNKFSNIRVMGTNGVSSAATGRIWLGKYTEAANCTFYTAIGTNGECWIHNCNVYGGRFMDGWEAAMSLSYRRDIVEYNRVETPVWPYDASKTHPYNHLEEPRDPNLNYYSWNIRFAENYCSELYMANNIGEKLVHGNDPNRGEIFLFHAYPGVWLGSIVSSSGLTTALRTDGLVNGEVVAVDNFGEVYHPQAGFTDLVGGSPVPDASWYGTLDSGFDEVAYGGGIKIAIVSGRGMGQIRRITAHTPSSVTVDRPWLVEPDSTSIAVISRFFTDNTFYKNDVSAFPVGYYNGTGASAGVAASHVWNLNLEGNISRRVVTGRLLNPSQATPVCWNEFRDEKAYDCGYVGHYMYTIHGEQGPGPGPLNNIGNAFRGGEVTVTGGATSTGLYGVAATIENGIGVTVENMSLEGLIGMRFGGINGPAPRGTILTSSPYGAMMYRNCDSAAFPVDGGVPEPIRIAYYSDGQFLNGNTYSGSSQTYFGVGAYQMPVALVKCARIKSYVGGHVDPMVVPIANAGIEGLTWTATPSESWITASVAASPTVAAEGDSGRLTIAVDTAGMTAGQHWGYVTVSTGAKTVKVGVCVDLAATPPAELSPVASFTATPAGGIAPVTSAFDASASTDPDGTIVNYDWDFGDGSSAAGVTANHTYSTPGLYLVTLTVTDDSGNTGIAVASIAAGAALTGVSITGNPAPPADAGSMVTLTASAIGGYNVNYKFLLRSGNTWSTLRDYSTTPTINWTVPSTDGYYAIRVLARNATSTGAYDVMSEISYPVGMIPTNGMSLWLRGDSGLTFDESGKVSGWLDQSGAGNNVSQGTGSKRPAYVTDSYEGKPAVRFTGPSQLLQAAGLVLTGNTQFTTFTVASPTSVMPNVYQYLWWNGTSSWAGYGCYINSTDLKLKSAWGPDSHWMSDPNPAVAGNWYKMSTRYIPGNYQGWLNGLFITTRTSSLSNFNGGGLFTVGNSGVNPNQGFYGDIGEIIIYNRALTDTERTNVENYILSKWSQAAAVTMDRLSDVKALSDQTTVSITTPKVVTAQSGIFQDGVYYISETDRTCGLKAMGGPTVSLWENVTLSGTVGTDPNGEKMLEVTSIDTRTSGVELGAIGMLNKSLTPSGVLTRVWGRVTETGDDYFIINDGSGSPVVIDTASLVTPITVVIQTGQYVAATGPAGKGDGGLRVVRPRSDADIQAY